MIKGEGLLHLILYRYQLFFFFFGASNKLMLGYFHCQCDQQTENKTKY